MEGVQELDVAGAGSDVHDLGRAKSWPAEESGRGGAVEQAQELAGLTARLDDGRPATFGRLAKDEALCLSRYRNLALLDGPSRNERQGTTESEKWKVVKAEA